MGRDVTRLRMEVEVDKIYTKGRAGDMNSRQWTMMSIEVELVVASAAGKPYTPQTPSAR
jgi:hypothetical protein